MIDKYTDQIITLFTKIAKEATDEELTSLDERVGVGALNTPFVNELQRRARKRKRDKEN